MPPSPPPCTAWPWSAEIHARALARLPFALTAGQRLDIDRSGLLQGQLTVAAVPEPQSLAMLLGGMLVLGGVLRRRGAQAR